MLASTARSVTRIASRRLKGSSVRLLSSSKKDEEDKGSTDWLSKPTLPFGIGKFLGEEPDNLIPTDRDRTTKPHHIPDFVPEDVKKDMKELGLEGIEELDELEAKNTEGYNDLGLVPPEGSGTFSSPILIPSRKASRVVGYQDPESHAMFWFTIHNDDNTYYIKDLGLFFKVLSIPPEETAAAH